MMIDTMIMDSVLEVGRCPYRLRVSYSKNFAMSHFDARRLLAMCSMCSDRGQNVMCSDRDQQLVHIGGDLYIGFHDFAAIARAFEALGTHTIYSLRMLDPYAIHVSIPHHVDTADLHAHFARYGAVSCVTKHSCGKGHYAFVNFMHRESSLWVLGCGSYHVIRGTWCKVRAKVLSAAEPRFPKPYSPARYGNW